ncbi:MAG TPA: hypothetical protein VJX67_20635 [Blastocatellia bacterium]|nr:hypothetical protein [Blastocatellia bacterium]
MGDLDPIEQSLNRPNKVDWVVGGLLTDPAKMFVLWAIKVGFCVTLDDFRSHYGAELAIEGLIDSLIQDGVVTATGSEFVLTAVGEIAVGCLPDTAKSPYAAKEEGAEPSSVENGIAAAIAAATVENPDTTAFEPSQEVFDSGLARLEPELPGIEARYKRVRHKLVKFFAWKRCDDPEGLADETVTRYLQHIQSGKEIHADNAYSFVYGIAANVFREYLRRKARSQSLMNTIPPPPPVVPDSLADCRKECLAALSSDKSDLLQVYYLDPDGRDRLAVSRGISLNALRLQVHRIRNALKVCHEECLKQEGPPK